jgi:L-threonylcarbamoyladenylate synthase
MIEDMSNDIALAARALSQGHLVAFPTETVYGLGADATNALAVARIYSTKGRPPNHPLIVHVSSLAKALEWTSFQPEYLPALATAFWPGPMTLILKRSDLAGDFVTGSQDTVGVRVPSHPVAQELLRSFEALGGKGVAAPSANRFGKVSPTTAEAVGSELGPYLSAADLILQGGECEVGIESTIIDCTSAQPAILRLGAVTASMVEEVTGLRLKADAGEIRVSGSLKSHYSPDAKLVLNQTPQPGDGLIALASVQTPAGVNRLVSPRDSQEFAKQLYAALRKADELGLERVVAITPAGDELAEAVLDRLTRASTKG